MTQKPSYKFLTMYRLEILKWNWYKGKPGNRNPLCIKTGRPTSTGTCEDKDNIVFLTKKNGSGQAGFNGFLQALEALGCETHLLGNDDAVLVDDVIAGDGHGGEQVEYLSVGVGAEHVVQGGGTLEKEHVTRGMFLADADDDEVLAGVFRRHALEVRDFLAAGRAGSGEEINPNYLPSQILHGIGFPIHGFEGEIGHLLPHDGLEIVMFRLGLGG